MDSRFFSRRRRDSLLQLIQDKKNELKKISDYYLYDQHHIQNNTWTGIDYFPWVETGHSVESFFKTKNQKLNDLIDSNLGFIKDQLSCQFQIRTWSPSDDDCYASKKSSFENTPPSTTEKSYMRIESPPILIKDNDEYVLSGLWFYEEYRQAKHLTPDFFYIFTSNLDVVFKRICEIDKNKTLPNKIRKINCFQFDGVDKLKFIEKDTDIINRLLLLEFNNK